MASVPITELTNVTPLPRMLIPVVDPAQPAGLKNGAVLISALVALFGNGSGGTTVVQGTAIETGAVAPIANVGNNGDFYFQSAGGVVTFYGPKSGGLWPAGVVLNGPAGPAGPAGAAGAAGGVGPAGPAGANGSSTSITTAAAQVNMALTDFLGVSIGGADGKITLANFIAAGGLATAAIVAGEQARAMAAEQANTAAIGMETTRAEGVEATLTPLSQFDAEVVNRTAATSSNAAAIAAEQARAMAAEASLAAGFIYQSGGYNAATNTPALAAGVANGTAYFVNTAGTPPTTVPGNLPALAVGQTVFSNGTIWIAMPSTYAPTTAPVFAGSISITNGLQISAVQSDGSIRITDPNGWVTVVIQPDGSIISSGSTGLIGGMTITPAPTIPGVAILDPYGWQYAYFPNGSGSAVASFSATDILTSDVAALAASEVIRRQNNVTAQRPTAQININPHTGQSEAQADQGSPTLTVVSVNGNVMFGASTRPQSQSGSVYTPVGSATLQPLVSVNQNPSNGAIQTPAAGGFQNISGATFVYSPNNVMTLASGATGTLVTWSGGVPTFTPVGGSGQPALDLTQGIFVGDLIQFGGLTGSLAYINSGGVADMDRVVIAVTPTTITVASGTTTPSGNGFAVNGTTTQPFSIYRTNTGGSFGEDMAVGMLNDLSIFSQFDNAAGTPINFGTINGAIAGQSIEQLSKGTSLYTRLMAGISGMVAAATAAGQTTCCPVISMQQGNQNVVLGTTQATYAADLATFIENLAVDVPALMTNPVQTAPPLFLMDQITGPQLSNSDPQNDGVMMAQFNFALAPPTPDVVVVGPTYNFTNTGVHPFPNGQRHKGAMYAKVARRIWRGEGWMPMLPTAIGARGFQVKVNFHVPVPPILFLPAYHLCTPTMFADAGFLITVGGVAATILGVKIVGAASVMISCAAIICPPGTAIGTQVGTLQYADGSVHNGLGNLGDSDAAQTPMKYIYVPFSGQSPVENIAAFTDTSGLTNQTFPSPVGQQYPLNNRCLAFNLPILAA